MVDEAVARIEMLGTILDLGGSTGLFCRAAAEPDLQLAK